MARLNNILLAGAAPIATPGCSHFDRILGQKLRGGELVIREATPGPIATFTTNIAKELASLIVNIAPVQSGTGDPSPDNIRPISGWDGCNVVRCGKNLFDKTTASLNRYINNTGGTTPSQYNQDVTDYIEVKAGATYTISHSKNNTNFSAFYDENKNKIDIVFPNDQFPKQAPSNAKYLRVTFLHGHIDLLQIETGSQSTDYVSYVASTQYPITFPSEAGTVYGGTLNVTNGVLRMDHAITQLSSSMGWTYGESSGRYRVFTQISGMKANTAKVYSEVFKGSDTSPLPSYPSAWEARTNSTPAIIIGLPSDYSLQDWKNLLDNETIHLVYPLATPLTYQLTPTEISTLLGTNNIWADTGDIAECKYYYEK